MRVLKTYLITRQLSLANETDGHLFIIRRVGTYNIYTKYVPLRCAAGILRSSLNIRGSTGSMPKNRLTRQLLFQTQQTVVDSVYRMCYIAAIEDR